MISKQEFKSEGFVRIRNVHYYYHYVWNNHFSNKHIVPTISANETTVAASEGKQQNGFGLMRGWS